MKDKPIYIRGMIRQRHNDFLKSVGPIPCKLAADHEWLLAKVGAKISYIAKVFISEKIIDVVK